MSRPPGLVELDRLLALRSESRVIPGLDRITEVLAAIGNPQLKFPSVLVLGTNGKGSTAAFLASLLQALGLRVGLYTSPHLVHVGERIRLNGEPLAAEEMLVWVQRLSRFPELSYFETLTATAFAVFAENSVDVAVVEAGLGGRWDATNVKAHEVALLTNIGTDHQQWLGPTRAHIAAEKAAALRGLEAILGEWDGSVLDLVSAHAGPGTRLAAAHEWVSVDPVGEVSFYPQVQGEGFGHRWQVRLPLAGSFQIANYRLALAGLAALCAHGLVPTPRTVDPLIAGTRATRWPGRLQEVHWRGRRFLLDGAHNVEAVEALVNALTATGYAGTCDLIFSCLSDKPLAAMARLLRPIVGHVQVVPLCSPRARTVEDLAEAFPQSRIAQSIPEALASSSPTRPTLITGSLRLVGEVLGFLQESS